MRSPNRARRREGKPLAPGMRRVRDDFTFLVQRDVAFSATAGVSLFNGSPFPAERVPVNCRIKSSIDFEAVAFSWPPNPLDWLVEVKERER
jgi:hypothetical protein